MKTYIDCIPCFVRQALEAARMASDDPDLHERALREALKFAGTLSFDDPPPVMGAWIHGLVRRLAESDDPYLEVKQSSNRAAMQLLGDLRRRVADSPDPFETAVRMAIAGNIIDYGVVGHEVNDDLAGYIDEALDAEMDLAALEKLRRRLASARRVLYLLDNAGEIVFDRLLIETIGPDKIVAVVRSSPIINDAVLEDAREVGLTEIVKVIDSGMDIPGTIVERGSDEFKEHWARADTVISKGQGNYETLSDVDKEIFFLLRIKCAVVARHLAKPVGAVVLVCP